MEDNIEVDPKEIGCMETGFVLVRTRSSDGILWKR